MNMLTTLLPLGLLSPNCFPGCLPPAVAAHICPAKRGPQASSNKDFALLQLTTHHRHPGHGCGHADDPYTYTAAAQIATELHNSSTAAVSLCAALVCL